MSAAGVGLMRLPLLDELCFVGVRSRRSRTCTTTPNVSRIASSSLISSRRPNAIYLFNLNRFEYGDIEAGGKKDV